MARHSLIEVATGAVVLLAAGGFAFYALANTGQTFAGDGYGLNASFDHVDGLSVGADVRVAGVKVGSVQSIRLDPKTYQAIVGFSVQNNVSLTDDSSATVSTDGLLGGKYVALATGGDDKTLKPGDTITITQGSVNIEALIGKYIFGSTGGKASTTPDAPKQGDAAPK